MGIEKVITLRLYAIFLCVDGKKIGQWQCVSTLSPFLTKRKVEKLLILKIKCLSNRINNYRVCLPFVLVVNNRNE